MMSSDFSDTEVQVVLVAMTITMTTTEDMAGGTTGVSETTDMVTME